VIGQTIEAIDVLNLNRWISEHSMSAGTLRRRALHTGDKRCRMQS